MFAFLTSAHICTKKPSVVRTRSRFRGRERTVGTGIVVPPTVVEDESGIVDKLIEGLVRVGFEFGLHRGEICESSSPNQLENALAPR